MNGTQEIVGLSRGQVKAGRVALGIDRRMNLGAQSATGAPDGVFCAPLFAPALC